ncbi:hypothetical protein SpCBS45565_g07017 [Spizellomyces sp. 'palustris']|nr:hypothetical protein SpCBS45565_g07017 [Spizellomyces sp. 'palustris']
MTQINSPPRVRARRNNAHQFNLMVAGHSFTGKTAYIKTLYDTLDVKAICPDDGEQVTEILPPDDITAPTASAGRIEFEIDQPGERISLRIIDTPGLPIPRNIHKDQDHNEKHVKAAKPFVTSLVSYLEAQFEATLLEESKVRRNPKSPDFQIHACLYFLDPQVCFACRGITAVDRYALEQLCSRVNVIVCFAKADLLTVRRLRTLRNLVVEDLARFGLPVFAFPEDPDVEYDKDAIELNEELRAMLPFAIVNAEEHELEDDAPEDDDASIRKNESPRILGREYPWGIVEVQNPSHCDFLRVKETLFITHLHELKLLTRELYYEQWRTEKLLEVRTSVLNGSVDRRDSFATTMTAETVKTRNMEEEIADEMRERRLKSDH